MPAVITLLPASEAVPPTRIAFTGDRGPGDRELGDGRQGMAAVA
jgi:hypothetical protein